MRELGGDQDGAARLARQAAEKGNTSVLVRLADIREAAGDAQGAGKPARLAAVGDERRGYRALDRLPPPGPAQPALLPAEPRRREPMSVNGPPSSISSPPSRRASHWAADVRRVPGLSPRSW
ncbi:hypothetical protein GCM10010129_71300 [Streptomyces fumigatiscleroticus]|nr:hypothetical protein GCM10010129_71300 [Streptomyces fumigatiscleroticus]